MSRGRKLLLAALGLLVVVAPLPVYLSLMTPPPGVTMENVDRLRMGMTKAQVKAILGDGGLEESPWRTCWDTNKLHVQVCFTLKDSVNSVYFREGTHADEWNCVERNSTFIDKIRRWLPIP